MQIGEKDLCYNDYIWNNHESKQKSGFASPNKNVDVNHAKDVLNLINSFLKKYDIRDKFAARKIEIMLREELPAQINKKNEIMNWIKTNW